MSDRVNSEIEKVTGYEALAAFAEVDDSLLSLQEYVVVPYAKVVQGMSKEELKDMFGEGAAVLLPGNLELCQKKGSFHVVPLFFYTQFRKWADKSDKTQMILESTYDPTSIIAKRAKDAALRSEVYEEDMDKEVKSQRFYRYVEHLTFICKIYGDHDHAGVNCVISFQKGDFRKGCNWATSIKSRKFTINDKRVPVPLWAQVWKMEIKLSESDSGKWWSMSPCAPDISPVISESEFIDFKQEYEDLKNAHQANRIRVDGDDSGAEEIDESFC